MLGKEGEVVTRQPYRKVRLDHLLSKENNTIPDTSRFYGKSKGKPLLFLLPSDTIDGCRLPGPRR